MRTLQGFHARPVTFEQLSLQSIMEKPKISALQRDQYKHLYYLRE